MGGERVLLRVTQKDQDLQLGEKKELMLNLNTIMNTEKQVMTGLE